MGSMPSKASTYSALLAPTSTPPSLAAAPSPVLCSAHPVATRTATTATAASSAGRRLIRYSGPLWLGQGAHCAKVCLSVNQLLRSEADHIPRGGTRTGCARPTDRLTRRTARLPCQVHDTRAT